MKRTLADRVRSLLFRGHRVHSSVIPPPVTLIGMPAVVDQLLITHSLRLRVSGFTGWDAFWCAVLPERWAARRVAKKVLAETYKGARFSRAAPFLLTMPNGRTWEVFHGDRAKLVVQLPTQRHEPTPPLA